MKKSVCLFVCLFTGSVNAAISIDNTVTGSITHDFEGLPVTGSVTGLISQGWADYGEFFTGQTLSTAGNFDSLSGNPITPLNLEANVVASDNIGIFSFNNGNHIIYGDLSGALGEGALSILFDSDTDIFGLDILGSNGGDFVIDFFSSNGSLLGSISQMIALDSFFGFQVTSGSLIRAVSITNTDFGGIGFDNVTFNGSMEKIPEPASIALLGLGLAGIGFSRKKKTT